MSRWGVAKQVRQRVLVPSFEGSSPSAPAIFLRFRGFLTGRPPPMYGDLKILTGTSNAPLAQAICEHLGCQLTPALCEKFSDGESRIEISSSVRGDDVFVIQPTCAPVNFNLMQLSSAPARAASPPSSPTTAMRVRTARSARARPSAPSSWLISCRPPVRTAW